MNNSIEKPNTKALITNTINNLINGISGIAISENKEYILSANRIVRSIRSGYFLTSLITEWEKYKNQGRITADYEFSEEHFNNLTEILDYLDNDIPNDKIFKVLKTIFLKSAIENQKDNLLPHQFLKIARKLNEGELIVLLSIYKIYRNPNKLEKDKFHYEVNIHYWEIIASESGLMHSQLIELHDSGLLEKKLLKSRLNSNKSKVDLEPYFGLSDFGVAFCNYIENFEN
jgi:hypothetical protein